MTKDYRSVSVVAATRFRLADFARQRRMTMSEAIDDLLDLYPRDAKPQYLRPAPILSRKDAADAVAARDLGDFME